MPDLDQRRSDLGARGLEERGADASPFVGYTAGMGFKVGRSSSNYDPKKHREERGWFDAPELAPAPPARRTSTAMAR